MSEKFPLVMSELIIWHGVFHPEESYIADKNSQMTKLHLVATTDPGEFHATPRFPTYFVLLYLVQITRFLTCWDKQMLSLTGSDNGSLLSSRSLPLGMEIHQLPLRVLAH